MAPTDSDQRLLSPQAVSFLALVALPVLAFVCAVLGLILVLQGKTLAGLVFLLVLTQVFAVGGLIAWNRRKRAQQDR
ncbi:NF038396 family protein [Micrococcus luteus]|uniref:NF038396 family protein n=1 Tax=Micrococcus luteus TaxID=1270 RepID=UPI000859410B|nr:NF038396 family protein [Micrococcus luteus]MCT2325102.1 NF038396 family protein [Micrococcus luteus]MCV7489285.1 NF038396 family protein [Micrococcus luteus]MCV7491139.1 NF038396 family protein [Micrococcus luteus]MCV7508780.1 NF038396 family protein [Micrococcus luteus]MCV7562573.1 NF038396 family protein [Micrococcus luteus]